MAGLKEIYFSLDSQTLAAAAAALEAEGLSVPGAVEILTARIAREQALPFSPPLSDEERASAAWSRRWTPAAAPREIVAFTFDERGFDGAFTALSRLGLSLEGVVGVMLERVARDGILPLSPNAETRAAMEEARRGDLKNFDTVEALLADLNAED